VRLSGDEYTRVRSDPAWFVVVPGHPTVGEPTGLAGDGWVCVTKQGKL
jgi:hypothetical protein